MANFHQRLKELLIEKGVSSTYTAEICVSDEYCEIVNFYEWCSEQTGNVEVFAQRACNTINGIKAEDEIEFLRREIG